MGGDSGHSASRIFYIMQTKNKIEKEKKWLIKGGDSESAREAAKRISSALNVGS